MKTKLLLILLMAALAVPMSQAQAKTDDLRAAFEQMSHITAGKASQVNEARTQYCQSPTVTYEFTGTERVTVTFTNHEAGARVYYVIYKSLGLFGDQELVDSGSFSGDQFIYDVEGGGYLYDVRFHAEKSGLTDSPEEIVLFTIDEEVAPVEQCAAPKVDYAVTGTEQVTMTFTNNESGSRVYFEIYRDGNRINVNSFTGSSYTYAVSGGGDYEVRAYSKKSGKDDSTVAGVLFTIVEEVAPLDKCVAPTITYDRTGYETVTVTFNNNESGARVYYEVYQDGDDLISSGSFTGSSKAYDFYCDGDIVVKAVAKKSGMEDSNWSGVYFTVDMYSGNRCQAPNLSYQMTGMETATVTIQNRESGATVYYYVYENNTYVFSGSFTGDQDNVDVNGEGDYDVYAIAKKSGMTNSYEGGVLFTIDDQVAPLDPCAAPHVSYQATGVEVVTVTMTNRQSGSRVYYEIYRDGSRIYQSSFTGSSYNYSVTGGGDYVVKAYSTKTNMAQSTVAGVLFTIVEEVAPVETPLAPIVTYQTTGYETVTVTITNREPGATVQYGVMIDGNTNAPVESFTGDSYSFNVSGAAYYFILSVSVKDDVQSSLAGVCFTILEGVGPVMQGDVTGTGSVDMDDLTRLINYLLDPSTPINYNGAAACDGVNISVVDMDDLTALINFLLVNHW